MKKIFVLYLMAAFASPAFAQLLEQDQAQGQAQGQEQIQAQGQQQGQAQFATGGDADARSTSISGSSAKSGAAAGAFSGGNKTNQNVTVTDSGKMHYSGSYEVENVPNVMLGNIYPTAPCMGSTSGGFSAVGFGVALGTSWTDDDCGLRETARSFWQMQMKDDAVKVLCASKYAATAPACMPK